RQVQTTLDTWIYSLAMLQTQSGYSGRGNYGIIRMNSGYGSRPLVGLAPGRPWGARFRRDLAVLLKEHEKLVHAHDRPRTGARALLWLEPWDGKTPIGLSECDPYVIEMARLIRLVEEAGSLVAYRKATQGQRLSPKVDVLKGNVGDPWIPVKSEGSALNIGPGGITYDRVRALLFQDGYRWSACQHPQPDDPPSVFFCAAAIARGQGGTEGFHERWIEIPLKRRWVLFDEHRRKTLGETARERVEQTANVRRRALHPALLVLLEGAPERRLNLKSNLDLRWLNVFEAKIDQRFFPNLWEDAELEGDEQKRRWARTLRGAAEEVLKLAEKEAPLADARRERALARAWMILRGGLKKWVPEAFESLEEAKNESAA
ncbi:MAG: type I-E CRISPR-associated protein Cse1/CasA, partial [Deltaproteobacteria bacterium]|nr:type I-E CRISPR-associated protein Cse1/CasA [Deltaproteobacteria bacterium]